LPRATWLLFQMKLYDGAVLVGLEAIQTPLAIRLNQLTGLDTTTVIVTEPETEVPEDGEITSGEAIAVALSAEFNTIAITTARKPLWKALQVCVFEFPTR